MRGKMDGKGQAVKRDPFLYNPRTIKIGIGMGGKVSLRQSSINFIPSYGSSTLMFRYSFVSVADLIGSKRTDRSLCDVTKPVRFPYEYQGYVYYVRFPFIPFPAPPRKAIRVIASSQTNKSHIEHRAFPSTPTHTKYPSLPYLSKLSASPPWHLARAPFKSEVSPFVSRTVPSGTSTFPF